MQRGRSRRVLVCGSRTWTDKDWIADELANYAGRPTTIVHGGARGADQMAGEVAELYGYDVEVYPADWEAHGKRAGILRNLQMLDTEPDEVIAFRVQGESRGTDNTVNEARKRGIPVTQCTQVGVQTEFIR